MCGTVGRMSPPAADARSRLTTADFGVLGTVDTTLGVHLVPVVFVVDESRLLIPVDMVKPKRSAALRRIHNLEAEPQATLLVDQRSDDWTELWWVRADLMFRGYDIPGDADVDLLAAKYSPYGERGSVIGIIELTITRITGWEATDSA